MDHLHERFWDGSSLREYAVTDSPRKIRSAPKKVHVHWPPAWHTQEIVASSEILESRVQDPVRLPGLHNPTGDS